MIPILNIDHFPGQDYEVIGSVVCTSIIPSSRTFNPFAFRPDGSRNFNETRSIIWFEAPYQKLTNQQNVGESTFRTMLTQDLAYKNFLWRAKEEAINEILNGGMERLAQKGMENGADAVIGWHYEIRCLDLGTSYPVFDGTKNNPPLPIHEHNATLIDFTASNMEQLFLISTGTMIRFKKHVE